MPLRCRGGWTNEREVPLRLRAQPRRDDTGTVELVGRRLHFYPEERIAPTLAHQGRRTPRGLPCTQVRVRALCQRHGVEAYRPSERDPSAPLLGVAAAAGSWAWARARNVGTGGGPHWQSV